MATDKWMAGELPDDALAQVSGGMATSAEMATGGQMATGSQLATSGQMATGSQLATGAQELLEEGAGPAGRFRTGKKRGPAGR